MGGRNCFPIRPFFRVMRGATEPLYHIILCQGILLLLSVHCQIDSEDCSKEQNLYADAHPVGVHGEGLIGKSCKHICDADIPVGRKKPGETDDPAA